MSLYAKESAEWTPLIDDKFRVELIDADSRRAVPVVRADIFLDRVHWFYRSALATAQENSPAVEPGAVLVETT